ncbi:MAG: hypothetical protein ACJ0DD_01725 [Paracoccaceae bacterium]|tara:strand:- start:364 stop:1089 length:726 start_codon:yes stop_codon:yes gene_type:complete
MELLFEILIIFFLVVFQSIFGVGLLLFGTPIFLLLGNNFESTLTLILPVSIIISILQIIYHRNLSNNHILEFNTYCLPFLVIFLMMSIYFGNLINIKLYVSVLLIISSLIFLNKKRIFKVTQNLLAYRKLFLITIGCIHGATNMGGAFLSIFSSLVNNENRLQTRNYIAYGYFVMGAIQYIAILTFGTVSVDFSKLYYIILPLIIFYPLQNFFSKMNDKFFITIINYAALFFGIIAFFRSI